MSIAPLLSAEHWTQFVCAVGDSRSESLILFRTYRHRRVGRLELLVSVIAREFEMLSHQSRTDDENAVKSDCSPATPLSSADTHSSSHFAGRPDAAMRCNFRFRLELVVLVVLGLAVASVATVPTTPVSNCRTAPFNDILSRAVRASIVFEGHISPTQRHANPAADVLVASQSSPSDVATGPCHVTFKVKRLIKGELPSVTRADRRRSSDRSSSSALEEFRPVIVRTRRVEKVVRGGDNERVENDEEDWCAATPIGGQRTNYVVFLSNAEEVEGAGSWTRHNSSSNRNRRVRGGTVPTTVFRFSSSPWASSKDRQLLDVDFNDFGERPLISSLS